MARDADYRDLYFFGYGHDYVGCLREYGQVSGRVPMVPRYALGNWWSRYWDYRQNELRDLMVEFHEKQVPLSVCIIDMDWHITRTGNASSGWTGYTWNREQWPDPDGFIAWLHEQGLRTAMNLHPADGIWPHEAQYEAMARWMGQDPQSQEPVHFDLADPRFVEGYFDILHHPMEAEGVDFWWLDWQQGQRMVHSRRPVAEVMDPLWWLNHLHFYDLRRNGTKRPFIFSRWGGLGNQRYPIGFSGDSWVTWATLEFQPYFTATASNVAFGWWSHDVGGHSAGTEDPELFRAGCSSASSARFCGCTAPTTRSTTADHGATARMRSASPRGDAVAPHVDPLHLQYGLAHDAGVHPAGDAALLLAW